MFTFVLLEYEYKKQIKKVQEKKVYKKIVLVKYRNTA